MTSFFIADKTLSHINYKVYNNIYLDKPVTRIFENNIFYTNKKIVIDTNTVTHFNYNPDAQFYSQFAINYDYNSNGKLTQATFNEIHNWAIKNYLYDNQNRLQKIIGGKDSTLLKYLTTKIYKYYEGNLLDKIEYQTNASEKIFNIKSFSPIDETLQSETNIIYNGNHVSKILLNNHPREYLYDVAYTIPEQLKNITSSTLENAFPILIQNYAE